METPGMPGERGGRSNARAEVGRGGFEPPTLCLKGTCSAVELTARRPDCNTRARAPGRGADTPGDMRRPGRRDRLGCARRFEQPQERRTGRVTRDRVYNPPHGVAGLPL